MPCLHCISWGEALTLHSFCIQMRHAGLHQAWSPLDPPNKAPVCCLWILSLTSETVNLWGCLIKDFLCNSPYLIANSAEVICFLWGLSLRGVVHSLFMWHVFFKLQAAREEPIHILNVAIKTDGDVDDDGLAAMFREFTQSKVSQLSALLLHEIHFRASSINPVATSEKAVLGTATSCPLCPLVPVFTCFPDGREELRLVGMNSSPGTGSLLHPCYLPWLREYWESSC